MKYVHPIAVVVLLSITGAFALLGWHFSTSRNPSLINVMLLGGGAMLCALLAFVVFFASIPQKRKLARNYAALIFACAFCIVYFSSFKFGNRVGLTRQTLESTFDDLEAKGPPFPPTDDAEIGRKLTDPKLLSTGYWVSPDRRNFEIYYHRDSNSFALVYPDRSWVWRPNRYHGPETPGTPRKSGTGANSGGVVQSDSAER